MKSNVNTGILSMTLTFILCLKSKTLACVTQGHPYIFFMKVDFGGFVSFSTVFQLHQDTDRMNNETLFRFRKNFTSSQVQSNYPVKPGLLTNDSCS